MPLLELAGWTFGYPVSSLIQNAQTKAREYSFGHLGSTLTEQNNRIAEFINDMLDDLLDENPALAITTHTYNLPAATTPGTNILAIPTDMRGQDIIEIIFVGTSLPAWINNQPVYFADRYKWDQIAVEWRNSSYSQQYPFYWTWDDDGQNIMFAPFPNNADVQVQVKYRVKATVVYPPSGVTFISSGFVLAGTVTITNNSLTMTGSGTSFQGTPPVTANSYLYLTNGGTYQVASVASATSLTLVSKPQATETGLTATLSTILGEIPIRFKNVPIYNLAMRLVEDIDTNKYAELKAKYDQANAYMQDEITKQLASYRATQNAQANPNRLFDENACFPMCGGWGSGFGASYY